MTHPHVIVAEVLARLEHLPRTHGGASASRTAQAHSPRAGSEGEGEGEGQGQGQGFRIHVSAKGSGAEPWSRGGGGPVEPKRKESKYAAFPSAPWPQQPDTRANRPTGTVAAAGGGSGQVAGGGGAASRSSSSAVASASPRPKIPSWGPSPQAAKQADEGESASNRHQSSPAAATTPSPPPPPPTSFSNIHASGWTIPSRRVSDAAPHTHPSVAPKQPAAPQWQPATRAATTPASSNEGDARRARGEGSRQEARDGMQAETTTRTRDRPKVKIPSW